MCLLLCEVAQGTNMAADAGVCSLFITTSAKEPALQLRLEQTQLWGKIDAERRGGSELYRPRGACSIQSSCSGPHWSEQTRRSP